MEYFDGLELGRLCVLHWPVLPDLVKENQLQSIYQEDGAPAQTACIIQDWLSRLLLKIRQCSKMDAFGEKFLNCMSVLLCMHITILGPHGAIQIMLLLLLSVVINRSV